MALINGTSTSAFLYCPSTTAPLWTTTYETVLLAACPTSTWPATYTIEEVCGGNPSDYVKPTMPPGFVVTTVTCDVCAEKEVEITCPGAQPTGMGLPTVTIQGNGVTATVVASPPPASEAPGAPAMGGASPAMGGASPAMPTATLQVVPASNNNNGGGVPSTNEVGSVPMNNNGSMPANPTMPVMAGASSTKHSLLVGAGLAFVAVPFLLL